MKRLMILGSAIAIAGLAALAWYATSEPAGPSADGTSKTEPAPSGRRPNKPGRAVDKPFDLSRKATPEDVPASKQEALERPEWGRNQALAGLRTAFSSGRYGVVMERSRALLLQDPDRHEVRAYLAMSACALGDEPTAIEAHAALPASRQQFVALRCIKFGMRLE